MKLYFCFHLVKIVLLKQQSFFVFTIECELFQMHVIKSLSAATQVGSNYIKLD